MALSESMEDKGIKIELAPGGKVIENNVIVGNIRNWNPPDVVNIEWNTAAAWNQNSQSSVKIRFEPIGTQSGTRISIESLGLNGLLQDSGQSFIEWFSDNIASDFFKAISPARYASWLDDKSGRRPAGKLARETYRNPVYHLPMFKAILYYLKLTKDDYLLEIGCGGGAFIFDALKSGCKAVAIDHSPDMVRVAKEVNAKTIEEQRLKVLESEAENLPFADCSFSCVASNAMFGFIDHPEQFLSEVCRVLDNGGRLVIFTASESVIGTIAAPEPLASLSHYYTNGELIGMTRNAGFKDITVVSPSLEPFAREAGVPEDVAKFFKGSGEGGQLLRAFKE